MLLWLVEITEIEKDFENGRTSAFEEGLFRLGEGKDFGYQSPDRNAARLKRFESRLKIATAGSDDPDLVDNDSCCVEVREVVASGLEN